MASKGPNEGFLFENVTNHADVHLAMCSSEKVREKQNGATDAQRKYDLMDETYVAAEI